MDQQTQTDKVFHNIEIEPEARSLFIPILKWARIAAILGIVSIALMLVNTFTGGARQASAAYMGGMYIGGSLIFVIPIVAVALLINIFLLRFSNTAKTGIDAMNQQQFNQGIGFLRSYFKTMGIAIIVAICLFLLFVLFFMIGISLSNQ